MMTSMKTQVIRGLGVMAILASVVSCASGSKSKNLFGKSDSEGYKLPAYQEKRLENGLHLVYVQDDSLPYVSFSMLIRAGAIQDPEKQAGLSAMVAELLDKGTTKRQAPQIAAEIGQMGADFDVNASEEYTVLSASALSTQSAPLLENVFEIATEPTFSVNEIERVRQQMIAQIQRRVDNPSAFAAVAFDDYLYAGHAYSRPVHGTQKSIAAISKKHIIQHYLRYYRPNNTIMAVVGKLTPEFQAQVEKRFGAWQPREVAPPKFGPAPEIKGTQIRLVEKPGLVQTQIRLGQVGITRQDPDFLALRAANTILGGAFESRLVNRVRKELGLTYTIGSTFDARLDRGPFEINTFTKNETTGQMVAETLKLVAEFQEKGVTSAEVGAVKGYLKGIFPSAIETPEKLAFNLMILRFYGVPDTYLRDYLKDIDNLSTGDINDAIKKHLDPKNMKVLVYSAPEVASQLQPLGTLEVKKASDYQ